MSGTTRLTGELSGSGRPERAPVDGAPPAAAAPWDPALVDGRSWVRAGIMGALARGRVLVVGAGETEVGLVAAGFGHPVIAVSTDDVAVRQGGKAALALGVPCRFGRADAADLPFPADSFDSVMLTGLAPCPGKRHPALAGALRVCRPGGRVIVSVPDAEHSRHRGQPGAQSRGSLAALLAQHGILRPHFSSDAPGRWLLAWLEPPKDGAAPAALPDDDLDEFLGLSPLSPRPEATDAVTVLVPTFNRAHLLRRALDSIYAQTYRNLEVIVIDDGSTDHTADVVAHHPGRPRYLRKPNAGKASALNAALPLVTGRYLCVADDDDLTVPHQVAQQVQALQAHPEAAMVYSADYWFHRSPRHIFRFVPARQIEPGAQLRSLLEFKLPTGDGGLYRVTALRAVGPFDERLVRSQTFDTWVRLARRFPFHALHFPTRLCRAHRGVRGALADRFSPDETLEKFVEYNRLIYRKWYWGLGLAEVDPGLGDATDPARLAAALVFRANLMLKRTLVEYASFDLQRAHAELRRAPWALPVAVADRMLQDLFKLDRLAVALGAAGPARLTRRLLRLLGRRAPAAPPAILRHLLEELDQFHGIERLRPTRRIVLLLLRHPRRVGARGLLARAIARARLRAGHFVGRSTA